MKVSWNTLCGMRLQVLSTRTWKKDTCLSLVKMSMLSCNTILVLNIQMSGWIRICRLQIYCWLFWLQREEFLFVCSWQPDLLKSYDCSLILCMKQLRKWQSRTLILRLDIQTSKNLKMCYFLFLIWKKVWKLLWSNSGKPSICRKNKLLRLPTIWKRP